MKKKNVSLLFSNCPALTHVNYDGTKEAWETAGLAAELPEGAQVHFSGDENAV